MYFNLKKMVNSGLAVDQGREVCLFCYSHDRGGGDDAPLCCKKKLFKNILVRRRAFGKDCKKSKETTHILGDGRGGEGCRI